MMFGWTIDKDHLADDVIPSIAGRTYGDVSKLQGTVKGVKYNLIDDDGIKYYSGYFFTDDPDGVTEEESYELWRWGAGYAGTVSLEFPGHPELDIG